MSSFSIGQPVPRVEDKRFVTGTGCFVDDINPPGQAYACILFSPHAHARIRAIDTAAARAGAGVLCVLTGADVRSDGLTGLTPVLMPEDVGGPKGLRTQRPILAIDTVRCVGERVAVVVAETLNQAYDAAELIAVDYEALAAVVGLEDAVKPGAPAVWEECPGNVCFEVTTGDEQAAEKAFAGAAHRVRLRLENNRITANTMEARVAIGEYNAADGHYTLHTPTQAPHAVRSQLAVVLGAAETSIRVISPDVGGGFGLKTDAFPEEAIVLWAARRSGRPVKWSASRSDALASDHHAREQVAHAELALDEKGKILAVRTRVLQALGSHVVSAGVAPILHAQRCTPGVYDIQTMWLTTKAVFTHTSPINVYRGAGRPEGNYVIERLLDRAAEVIGIARDEIRRRNFIPPDAMPYASPGGSVYDSGEFERLMDECMALADWQGYEARRVDSERAGKLRGRSVVYYIEHAGIFNERMELRFDPGGGVTIVAGTHSHGQGHATVFAQMVSDWLGVPFASIRYLQGDTDQVPFGRGTYAARSSLLGGNALRLAADEIIAKGRAMAAHLLEVAAGDIEFGDGEFRVAGTDRGISMVDTAKGFFRAVALPPQFDLGLGGSGTYSGDVPSYPNGCHVCEVEIDSATGATVIDRYTVVDDVGVAINPMICEGQIQGGVAQGIGQALMENIVYDAANGQLLSGSFLDYAMPRADHMGRLTTVFSCVPSTTNALGLKGVGESGTIGAPPAVMNAVIDALRPLGASELDMPATPHRVWRAINLATGA